jgi:hypothetical protein
VDELLRRLLEKGKQSGNIHFHQLCAYLTPEMGQAEVDNVLDLFKQHGVEVRDDELIPALPLWAALRNPAAFRDPSLLSLVRGWGIPATDAISRRDASGKLYVGSLMVAKTAAVEAWVELRTRLDVFPHWPLIRREYRTEAFSPEEGLPDRRTEMGLEEWRRDAGEWMAEAELLTPEPWAFRTCWRIREGIPKVAPAVFDLPKLRPIRPTRADLAWVLNLEVMAVQEVRPELPSAFVRIDLAPVPVSADVFAYWPFGGWNDAPRPPEQLAMVRHWDQIYGAELISDVMTYYEMIVWSPPTSPEASLRLADEMAWFGEETILGYEDLTAEMRIERVRTSRLWHFWWD